VPARINRPCCRKNAFISPCDGKQPAAASAWFPTCQRSKVLDEKLAKRKRTSPQLSLQRSRADAALIDIETSPERSPMVLAVTRARNMLDLRRSVPNHSRSPTGGSIRAPHYSARMKITRLRPSRNWRLADTASLASDRLLRMLTQHKRQNSTSYCPPSVRYGVSRCSSHISAISRLRKKLKNARIATTAASCRCSPMLAQ
jgi:hypothetical protein